MKLINPIALIKPADHTSIISQHLKYLIPLLFLLPLPGRAVEVPKGLSLSELPDVVQILGINSSGKMLSNPFPMGGYMGLEVGLSIEIIRTVDLSRLGDKTGSQRELRFPRISVGKGLYYDIDLFVHFIPFNENSDISDMGGMLRWNFFQAQYLPISLSAVVHSNILNIEDTFISQSIGYELLTGVNVENIALYLGAGQVEATTVFNQNVLSSSVPLNNTNTYRERVSNFHTFVGISLSYKPVFLAFQIDRYIHPVYSSKLGVRY